MSKPGFVPDIMNFHGRDTQRLTPLQEALWTVLNDHFDLDVESFEQMWPELSSLLARHDMAQRQIPQDRVWLRHEDGTPKTNDEIREEAARMRGEL